MGKKSNFSKSEKVAAKVFTIIEWFILAAIVGGFCIYWKLGVAAVIFLIWSEYWYAHGTENWVTDEHEQGGYPTEGLRIMFISWIFFAVIAALVIYFFL